MRAERVRTALTSPHRYAQKEHTRSRVYIFLQPHRGSPRLNGLPWRSPQQPRTYVANFALIHAETEDQSRWHLFVPISLMLVSLWLEYRYHPLLPLPWLVEAAKRKDRGCLVLSRSQDRVHNHRPPGMSSADAAAATAEVEGGMTKINEVWHVRHGQKCIEVKGEERQLWRQSPRFKRVGYFDTFLTRHGHLQASRAGLYLKSLPFNKQPGGFDVVYASPMARTVQTAVCISLCLGDLPLQIVPGLCSCTAALERIGPTAQENLMTDEEIREIFPWVTVIPRDPLAPTTMSGAADWLAAKASEKKGTEDDGHGGANFSRVLVVGHQEGTKAMAGAKVPTPHCCIGIFRTDAPENTYQYELHDLLSHTGTSINPSGESSSYAGPVTDTTGEESTPQKEGCGLNNSSEEDGGDSAEMAMAEQVIALTVSAVKGARAPVV